MKVIIIGAGKVGLQLVESLLNEKHDVIVIDNDQEVINRLDDTLDVLAVKGNGVSINLLRKVECENAALLIAVTNSDEANIVSCINAKKLGAKSVIARIRDPEYVEELEFIRKNLDIDYIINPELATAYEILRLLSSTYGSYTEEFAGGNVRLTEIQVDRQATIIDKQIKELKIPKGVIITAIARGSDIIIPNGSDYIFAKDILYLLGERNSVDMFAKAAGAHIVSGRVRDVMISGGGLTAFYLAQALEKKNINVKIVEQNEEKCRELSEQLEKTLILNGDGTDISLLKAEQVEGMDAFVSLTGFDEENILVALLAKQLGAKKVIAK
ncbi:MAG TPA: Trk system potassium transporter TrkA, partial [Firmicutes bacterium]|nr:Trk system potassium transporter TrkA [Bacillota bacterium]